METWQVLSAAVIALLIIDPGLVANAGFQLSVAATVGVIVGARWPSSGGKVMRALAVSIGAQVAVAPLLILHFGVVRFSPRLPTSWRRRWSLVRRFWACLESSGRLSCPIWGRAWRTSSFG